MARIAKWELEKNDLKGTSIKSFNYICKIGPLYMCRWKVWWYLTCNPHNRASCYTPHMHQQEASSHRQKHPPVEGLPAARPSIPSQLQGCSKLPDQASKAMGFWLLVLLGSKLAAAGVRVPAAAGLPTLTGHRAHLWLGTPSAEGHPCGWEPCQLQATGETLLHVPIKLNNNELQKFIHIVKV